VGRSASGRSRSPVKLFTAVRQKGVAFNQLDDRNMGRIRYQKVSEADGEVVPAEHIVKGVEVSRGRYVLVDPEELAPFVPLATKSIDVESFVGLDEIDPVFFESTYYVAPAAGAKPYALLVRALQSTGKVAIVRFVMRGRQYTAALRAVDGRLTLSTLGYADELVNAAEVAELVGLDAVEVSDREVKMAEMLVESLTSGRRASAGRGFGRRDRIREHHNQSPLAGAVTGRDRKPLANCPCRVWNAGYRRDLCVVRQRCRAGPATGPGCVMCQVDACRSSRAHRHDGGVRASCRRWMHWPTASKR
jgi:Ku protein